MGKPLTIKPEDDARLISLKKQTGAKSKVEVIRNALTLLELKIEKQKRIDRWRKAAKVVGSSSLEVLKEFQTKNRFKDLP